MEQFVEVIAADLQRPDHQQAVLVLTDAYARDPMGGGTPLPAATRERLVPALQRHPTTLIFLAYINGREVGLATCFLGLSTFSARPLLNIHDLVVEPESRGRGVGRRLLSAVEQRARELGCCKVTLEVGETNTRARHVYELEGFTQAKYGEAGRLLFYSKTL